jgi:hypothetical protein
MSLLQGQALLGRPRQVRKPNPGPTNLRFGSRRLSAINPNPMNNVCYIPAQLGP